MKKFQLLVLIDSPEYTFNEIYQSQLWERASQLEDLNVTYVTLEQIRNTVNFNLSSFDAIYVALKIRNTITYVTELKNFLRGHSVIVQDYDPWCNYMDDSRWKNGYKTIVDNLNVKKFFVSSGCWTTKLCNDGIPSEHIKLGMLNRYISNNSHANRRNTIEFRGTKHSTRLIGYQKMSSAQVPVQWLPAIKPYQTFLNDLDNLGTWCHDESEPLIVNGKETCSNWVWPKGLEVLHRGCFLMRDYQPEAVEYEMDWLPTVFLFLNYDEAKIMSEQILTMSIKEKDERMNETLNILSKIDYYSDILNQIKTTANE